MLYNSHTNLRHNDRTRLYQFLKRQYCWKCLKKSVHHFIRQCLQCQMTNWQTSNYAQLHLGASQMPMDFIAMHLIGLCKITLRENKCVLNMICILTNNVICASLVEKSADTVVNTYLKELYCRFGRSHR